MNKVKNSAPDDARLVVTNTKKSLRPSLIPSSHERTPATHTAKLATIIGKSQSRICVDGKYLVSSKLGRISVAVNEQTNRGMRNILNLLELGPNV